MNGKRKMTFGKGLALVTALAIVAGIVALLAFNLGGQQSSPAAASSPATVATAPETPEEPATPTPEETEPEETPPAGSPTDTSTWAPPDERYDLKLKNLTLGLTGWTPDKDKPSTMAAKFTAEGLTELNLYEAPASVEEFVASYKDCGAPLTVKGQRHVGSKPATYLEGTQCGSDQQRFNRVWLVGSEGLAVVASSTVEGDLNGVDQIMFKYAGWKQ